MAPEKKIIKISSRQAKRVKKLNPGDFWITALVLGLVVFGVVMIFSASYYYAINEEGTPYYYLVRSIIWALIGTVVMMFMATFDYHKLERFAWPILIGEVILLCLLFTPLGMTLNNATRWLDLKIITIMPGELAKPACIIFVAAFFSKIPERARSFTRGILPMVILIGVVCGLIYIEPSTSTALTTAAVIMVMLFIAGLPVRYMTAPCIVGVAGVTFLILTDDGHRIERIKSFLDPFADPRGTGYQVIQGLLAMGSGGLFGVGLGKSMQKTLYLPEPQNDFILAIIGEELGYIGLLLLLIAYLVLIWRCIHIALNAPDTFGMLLASGITIMLAVQVIFNILVVTSLMPPTGVVLPFVSWGGNALVIFMACMGSMLNISRHSAK